MTFVRAVLGVVACVPCLLFAAAPAHVHAEEAAGVRFAPWSKATFERARRERRIVVVTVSTSWCHWCHVMKRETYGDARVRALLARSFLPVDVDADARPDLAERFRNYRWPATGFLTADGEPILALRGYRSPKAFLSVLADVRHRVARGGPFPGFVDPSAGRMPPPDVDRDGLVALRRRLVRQLDRFWDPAAKGWGRPQKYPLPEPVEYGLVVGRKGGRAQVAERRALKTLDAMMALLDPVDGGMYQYSLEGRWDRWHPEKIMEVNAGALGAYADAYRLTGKQAYLRAAQTIRRWLRGVLRNEDGSYRTSQDADAPRLAGERYYRLATREARRPYGTPRVDPNVYARENGLAIQALVKLYRAGGDATALADAQAAARRVLKSHALYIGVLWHAPGDDSGRIYLSDQVEMGRALLALHQADLDEQWLMLATRIAEAMLPGFGAGSKTKPDGFFDALGDPDVGGYFGQRRRSLAGNASAARFLLTLGSILSEPSWREHARRAVRSVARKDAIRAHGPRMGALALAVEQQLAPYATITVTGPAGDASAVALAARARERIAKRPWIYLRRETEGRPAAIVCGASFCSEPVLTPAALDEELDTALEEVRQPK